MAALVLLALVLLPLLAGSGCDDSQSPPATATLQIGLDHVVGGDSLRFDDRRYTNASGSSYEIHQLMYYVSDAVLVREDSTTVAIPSVHFRDASAAATRTWRLEGVPFGRYTALRFTFGLDSLRNVSNALPPTVDNLRMAWPVPMGGGYHYMMLDGTFTPDGGGTAAWAAHMGRIQMDMDPVAHHHDFQVELPLGVLDLGSSGAALILVLDVNAWFQDPVYDFRVFGGSMMDNHEAQRVLQENGPHVFSWGGIGFDR